MQRPLLAGPIMGPRFGVPIGMGASEVVTSWSGNLVIPDASGYFEIADAGDTEITGWAEVSAQTCSTTEGGTKAILIASLDTIFRMPMRYDASTYTVNYSDSLIGEVCDLKVISNVQYANPTLSTEDVIRILGGSSASSSTANDGFVDFSINPLKQYQTGTID